MLILLKKHNKHNNIYLSYIYIAIFMKNTKAFYRQKEIITELKELKDFIEKNANEPIKIIKKLKKLVYGFDKENTTSNHRAETMRRMIWLCDKYLTDKQWYFLLMNEEMETLFDDFTKYFISTLMSLSVEEMCDILWTYGLLGYRPLKLIEPIVRKMDRILLAHKKKNFGYESSKNRNKNKSELEEEIDIEKEYKEVDNEFDAEELRVYGYIRGKLKLPFKPYQLSDIVYSYGNLRIESGGIVKLLESMIIDHFEHNNR